MGDPERARVTKPDDRRPKPHKEKGRDRVLGLAELKMIWRAAGDDDFRRDCPTAMLTGQRATEISALRWSELTDGAIVLPSEQTSPN